MYKISLSVGNWLAPAAAPPSKFLFSMSLAKPVKATLKFFALGLLLFPLATI